MRPVRRSDNLVTSLCLFVRNSLSLSLLEPSGPVQACSGTAFIHRTPSFVLRPSRKFSLLPKITMYRLLWIFEVPVSYNRNAIGELLCVIVYN